MTILVAPDIELVLTSRARTDLASLWPDLTVDREKPRADYPRIITIQRVGGYSVPPTQDWQQVAVNVYAPTNGEANQLAADVAGWLASLAGDLFIAVRVNGIGPVGGRSDPPRRYFTSECLTRKEPRL